jgi:hypothetical protein
VHMCSAPFILCWSLPAWTQLCTCTLLPSFFAGHCVHGRGCAHVLCSLRPLLVTACMDTVVHMYSAPFALCWSLSAWTQLCTCALLPSPFAGHCLHGHSCAHVLCSLRPLLVTACMDTVLERLAATSPAKELPVIYRARRFITFPQQPDTGPYLEPDESTRHDYFCMTFLSIRRARSHLGSSNLQRHSDDLLAKRRQPTAQPHSYTSAIAYSVQCKERFRSAETLRMDRALVTRDSQHGSTWVLVASSTGRAVSWCELDRLMRGLRPVGALKPATRKCDGKCKRRTKKYSRENMKSK